MKQLFLTLCTLFTTLSSYACDCSITPFASEATRATRIFIGKAIYKREVTTLLSLVYHFSISQVFKGTVVDTLSITTGFGGPDCGMNFEIGKTYVVYAYNDATNRCSRNSLIAETIDLGKLKYLFQTRFSDDTGKSPDPILTTNEAEYFNLEFSDKRKDFNFHKKKVAFILGNTFHSKEQYFKNWGGAHVENTLIVLTAEEKQDHSDYDAIIVSWRKHAFSGRFRQRVIKMLK